MHISISSIKTSENEVHRVATTNYMVFIQKRKVYYPGLFWNRPTSRLLYGFTGRVGSITHFCKLHRVEWKSYQRQKTQPWYFACISYINAFFLSSWIKEEKTALNRILADFQIYSEHDINQKCLCADSLFIDHHKI